MLNKEKFANRLKTLRQNSGISTRSLAAAIGLKSHGAIAQFEKGTALPAIDTLVKLAEHFEVTLDYLVGVTDIPYPIPPNIANIINNTTNPSELIDLLIKTSQLERHESSDKSIQFKIERETETLIAGLDGESIRELHKFLRYLHARQILDGDDETSCGLDIDAGLKKA